MAIMRKRKADDCEFEVGRNSEGCDDLNRMTRAATRRKARNWSFCAVLLLFWAVLGDFPVKANQQYERERVLVIGCGPAGMFFGHALESRRRELASKGDLAGLASLPVAACLDRASGPGGVWRSERVFGDNEEGTGQENTQMYEALWTNGPKEGIEFFDYTYDEHFSRPLPVYMPRASMLEYMVARVTKHNPTFFHDYAEFNTLVQSVRYNKDTRKFHIQIKNLETKVVQTREYDKCIWAAGGNGKPKMPKQIVQSLEGFHGNMFHSTKTITFAEDVKDKRVLIVGGSYSAEDLALMACKVGVKQVYITSRNPYNTVTFSGAWPGNKVQVLVQRVPIAVSEDGNSIKLALVEWDIINHQYVNNPEDIIEIKNIDTVILCTGYEKQLDMLDPLLQEPFRDKYKGPLVVPDNWKMRLNGLSSKFGDVPTGNVTWLGSFIKEPDIYNGVLISNPNMMYLRHNQKDYVLLGIDALAWFLMNVVTGFTDLPSAEEMKHGNTEQALEEMQNVYMRYQMDSNYRRAFAKWPGDDAWSSYYDAETDFFHYDIRILAQTMQIANYPVDLGDILQLNANGKAFVFF